MDFEGGVVAALVAFILSIPFLVIKFAWWIIVLLAALKILGWWTL